MNKELGKFIFLVGLFCMGATGIISMFYDVILKVGLVTGGVIAFIGVLLDFIAEKLEGK